MEFEYPEMISASTSQARDRINSGILRAVLRKSEWPAADSGFHTVDSYAKDFMKRCAEIQTRPSAPKMYDHKRVTIFRYTPPVLSFRCDAEVDEGGVHPAGTTFFLNFDSSTGNAIGITDLITSLPKLAALAEVKFRRDHQLSSSESLARQSYTFPGDRFRLNDNFGAGEECLVFFFNTYEIGPGAMGSTEIKLPYQEIGNLLKVDLHR